MTHKENITAILECYFTGFKKEIIDSACNRILEQERFMNKPCVSHNELANAIEYLNLEKRFCLMKFGETKYTRILDVIIDALDKYSKMVEVGEQE